MWLKKHSKMFRLPLLLFLLLVPRYAPSRDPRLLFTEDQVSRLKEKIRIPRSHHHELFCAIKARVDGEFSMEYKSDSDQYSYSLSCAAVENALMFRLTDEKRYAMNAYGLLRQMYSDGTAIPTIPDTGSRDRKEPGSKALTHAFPGVAYGLCYDWCSAAWSPVQRSSILASIKAALDDWEALFRWELYDMPHSNWVSVCRGTELVLMLGGREEDTRSARYEEIKDQLREHYRLAYGSSGYSHEGLGYIHYGVPFGYLAMYCARAIGDRSLDSLVSGRSFWKLLMYCFASTPDGKHLMTSVDSDHPFGEGLFGLVMGSIPRDSLGYYKYFYDRTVGHGSARTGMYKYDQSRLGAIWNLLYYPDSVQAEDPSEVFHPLLADHDLGAYFFRNRWKNENDILLSFMGKFERPDPHGWMMAETFHISATAYDSWFISQTGKNFRHDQVSGLLVDGAAWGSQDMPHRDGGLLEYFKKHDDGAYLIVNGAEKYANMGVRAARRHFYVDFEEDSAAMFCTYDRLESGETREYRWQLNTGRAEGTGDIRVSRGVEHGVPFFLLEGKQGGYLKGWSLLPGHMRFRGTDPLFLEVPGRGSQEIIVLMYLGQGTPPEMHATERDTKYRFFRLDHGRAIRITDGMIRYGPR